MLEIIRFCKLASLVCRRVAQNIPIYIGIIGIYIMYTYDMRTPIMLKYFIRTVYGKKYFI